VWYHEKRISRSIIKHLTNLAQSYMSRDVKTAMTQDGAQFVENFMKEYEQLFEDLGNGKKKDF